jgi:hypothetical protein
MEAQRRETQSTCFHTPSRRFDSGFARAALVLTLAAAAADAAADPARAALVLTLAAAAAVAAADPAVSGGVLAAASAKDKDRIALLYRPFLLQQIVVRIFTLARIVLACKLFFVSGDGSDKGCRACLDFHVLSFLLFFFRHRHLRAFSLSCCAEDVGVEQMHPVLAPQLLVPRSEQHIHRHTQN